MKIKGWKKSPQNGMGKHVDKTKKQENAKKQRKAKWKMKLKKHYYCNFSDSDHSGSGGSHNIFVAV